jgi:hypothetical protein
MQFVPIIPRAGKLLENWLEVKRLAAVRPARPVEPRTLPPLLTPARAGEHLKREDGEERREAQQIERRRYCRRIQHLPILEELRSAVDRRKHSQRGSDQTGHIDEEA